MGIKDSNTLPFPSAIFSLNKVPKSIQGLTSKIKFHSLLTSLSLPQSEKPGQVSTSPVDHFTPFSSPALDCHRGWGAVCQNAARAAAAPVLHHCHRRSSCTEQPSPSLLSLFRAVLAAALTGSARCSAAAVRWPLPLSRHRHRVCYATRFAAAPSLVRHLRRFALLPPLGSPDLRLKVSSY